ncbi:histidine phosphatase family protein [Candidatus Gottesmanbacteria bacterium]|nr:histidine phosphatase family protein [Candidatus Gottesmanbacteria bacterium]
MKTIIYLVRHGEVHNPEKIFYGRLPGFGLSELGKSQAETLAALLKTRPIAALYTSPLMRAVETAGYVGRHFPHLTPIVDERLIEVGSPLEGRSWEELERNQWNFYRYSEHTRGGGEHLSDIWKRMRRFLAETAKKHKGQEIAAISHGEPIMVTHTKFTGKRLHLPIVRQHWVENAQGIRLVFNELGAVEVAKLTF